MTDLAAIQLTRSAEPGIDEVSLVEAIAVWCEALHGRQPLLTALGRMAAGLGARAACISRHSKGSTLPAKALLFNGARSGRTGDQLLRSYAGCVLGRYVDRPKVASVWLSSMAEEHGDPALSTFQQRARIAETVVITLAVEEKWVDYLEFHFGTPVAGSTQAMMNMLADTLSRTWLRRNPGLFSENLLVRNAASRAKDLREPVLSPANPARLSRAEFRVCLLLSRGLNTKAVCAELEIGAATLKAHLRNIFAKTKTTCLAELIFQLLAPTAGPAQREASPQAWRA
jgi:DNA-binding CsgD family transcriptional regulator